MGHETPSSYGLKIPKPVKLTFRLHFICSVNVRSLEKIIPKSFTLAVIITSFPFLNDIVI